MDAAVAVAAGRAARVEMLEEPRIVRHPVRVTKAILGGADDEFVQGVLSNEHGDGFQLFIATKTFSPASLALARGPDTYLKGSPGVELLAARLGFRTKPPPERTGDE